MNWRISPLRIVRAIRWIRPACRPRWPVLYRDRFCADPVLLADVPAGHIAAFAMTQLDISATRIRALLSKGHSPRYLMPDVLVDYIQDHHLYSEK